MTCKRILFFIESLGSGGAEYQLSSLAIMLKKKGYEVKIITYADRPFYRKYVEENDVEYECKVALKNRFVRPLMMIQEIRHFHADLVISFLTSTNLSACVARMLFKYPLIVSERNTTQNLTLKYKIMYNLYRFADCVVPNSYSQKKFLEENFSFLKHKIEVITNFTDTEKFYPLEKNRNNDVPIVTTIARYFYQKNGIRYLKAISILKKKGIEAKFFWYGNIHQEAYREMRDLVDMLDLSDYMELCDQVENPLYVYHNSDIFCLPSLYEGYPNVICEAMACGLPIVCSNVCDNPLIVENGVGGFLFNPISEESIANALELMINLSKEDKLNMSRHNRRCVVELNSSIVFLDKYLSLIKKIEV